MKTGRDPVVASLDVGSPEPISVPMETVEVNIRPEVMVYDYADAFVKYASIRNPLRFKQVGLSVEEMREYVSYLIDKRIESVNNDCPDWRKLKVLYMPVWIQACLRYIGKVVFREKGLVFMPVKSEKSSLTIEEAVRISDKVAAFCDDLNLVEDAMPREIYGDINVMSVALIDEQLRSIDKISHVTYSYISAFLGFKLKEEQAMRVLYRISYDDLNFVKVALMDRVVKL